MGEIVTVNFRQDTLYGFKQDDGIFLAVKPMCDAMGIAWEPQRKRINRDPVLHKATSIMEVPFGGAKGQETTCILLKRVNYWLATIDARRITDEIIRDKVVLYQEECADALYEHFAGRSALVEHEGEPSEKPSANESRGLVTEVRQTFGIHAARQLYFKLGLPRVEAMYAPGMNDLQADFFHPAMVRVPERTAA